MITSKVGYFITKNAKFSPNQGYLKSEYSGGNKAFENRSSMKIKLAPPQSGLHNTWIMPGGTSGAHLLNTIWYGSR